MKRTLATLFLIVSSVNIYGMKKKVKKFINKVLNTSKQNSHETTKTVSKLLDHSTDTSINTLDMDFDEEGNKKILEMIEKYRVIVII